MFNVVHLFLCILLRASPPGPRRMSERDLSSRLGHDAPTPQQIHSSKSVPALHSKYQPTRLHVSLFLYIELLRILPLSSPIIHHPRTLFHTHTHTHTHTLSLSLSLYLHIHTDVHLSFLSTCLSILRFYHSHLTLVPRLLNTRMPVHAAASSSSSVHTLALSVTLEWNRCRNRRQAPARGL
jgi:hypothetical protein